MAEQAGNVDNFSTDPSLESPISRPDTSADWESVLFKDVKFSRPLEEANKASGSAVQQKTTPVPKQRGRGVFTYGEMGMHSDRPSSESSHDELDEYSDEAVEESERGRTLRQAYGTRHVLVITFSAKVVTKDLEILFQPFALQGVFIRWVNDTTALAVFRTPGAAKEALQCIKNPIYHVRELCEDDALHGSFSEKDLEPPIPRPITSADAAHRMIMGALQKQGIATRIPPQRSYHSTLEQEAERKQRLLSRQKLRDEAWGPDD